MNIFKFITGAFLAACLFSSSLLAQSTTWNRGIFQNVGVVGQIRSSSIIIDDGVFRLSPTAKFSTIDNHNANFDSVKVNQMVGYNFIIINSRFIVDHLWLIPESERTLYRPE